MARVKTVDARLRMVAVALVVAGSVAALGLTQRQRSDYGSCAGALEELQDASRQAKDAAEAAARAIRDVDDKRDQVRTACGELGFASTCQSARSELADAESTLANNERTFRSAYKTVDGKVDSLHLACSAPGTLPGIPGVAPAHLESCTMLRSFRTPPMGLIGRLNSMCRELGLSEGECKICFGENYREKGQ
jgi:hypothetical protein